MIGAETTQTPAPSFRPRLRPGSLVLGGLALCVWCPAVGFAGAELIFPDGFESGNTLAWTSAAVEPAPAAADSFRMSDLDLRDPHVFVSVPPFGCLDFTDNPLPLGLAPSLNAQIETAIVEDGDDPDADLDFSSLLLFRPYVGGGSGERLDLASGACPAPFPATTCGFGAGIPQTTSYDTLAGGTCLAALPGTTSGYSPAVGSTTAPCWVSAPRPLALILAGLELPLGDVQLAGVPIGGPPTGFQQGLMRGFLRQADADLVLLPADLGGQPLSTLFRRGLPPGSCPAGDDRELHGGEIGWWFYFAFAADSVTLTGS